MKTAGVSSQGNPNLFFFFSPFFPDLGMHYEEVFTGLVCFSLSLLPDSFTASCNFFSAFPAAS